MSSLVWHCCLYSHYLYKWSSLKQHRDSSIIRLRPTHPNHVWSIDFVHDKLSNGRSYKLLTVLDEYTRQGLRGAVAFKLGSADVLEALCEYGKPELIRSDNGPELIAASLREWSTRVGIKPIQIYPGSPWENGYNHCPAGDALHR